MLGYLFVAVVGVANEEIASGTGIGDGFDCRRGGD